MILLLHAQTEDKSDDTKDSFYKELEYVFILFPKYHVKILLGDFKQKKEEKISETNNSE
jgi:hypothetical protein